MKSPLKKRNPPAVSCYKTVLKDPRLSDGALRTFLCLKARSSHEIVKVEMRELAKDRGIRRETILTHIKELYKLRLIGIKGQSSRGMQGAHLYLIDDRHFSQFLATSPRCAKKRTPVSSIHTVTAGKKVHPKNVISLADAKASINRAQA